jgi:hypothetical protein
MNKKFEFITEWSATALLLLGVALTSFNVFPINLWISLVGNLLWLIIAVIWRKASLLVVQLVIVALYIAGIYKEYLM